jgi:hypothetical protein
MPNNIVHITALIFFVVATNHSVNAQTFGKPEEEQVRLSSMSQDVEKLSQLTDKLRNIRKQRLLALAPIEKKPRSVVEKWKQESDALSSYISMFQDLHGASSVLLNAIGLSLQVTDRSIPLFHLMNICLSMPGEGMQFISLKKRSPEDRSVVRIYSFLGEGVLEKNEMSLALDGLQISDRLANSFNALCNRATKPENWIKN